LIGQTDAEFEELRRKVSTLGSGMTPDEMEHKLLAELAEALRTAKADTPYGRALVGDNGLRLFFTDPLFEKHLLRDGSFIRRRAEHALRGRGANEGDVPLEFTAEELPLDIGDFADIQEAARATQRLFRQLMSNASMQAEAVRLINDNLDIAVMKAASLAVGDIGQAFKRIREKLVGEEIILLIEDVALIQGVRRDLLDAVIEVGVVQGVERYATVRTLSSCRRPFGVGRRPVRRFTPSMWTSTAALRTKMISSTSLAATSTPRASGRTGLKMMLRGCQTPACPARFRRNVMKRSGHRGRITGSTHITGPLFFEPFVRAPTRTRPVIMSTSTHARFFRGQCGTS
jgi:hypothetical protein